MTRDTNEILGHPQKFHDSGPEFQPSIKYIYIYIYTYTYIYIYTYTYIYKYIYIYLTSIKVGHLVSFGVFQDASLQFTPPFLFLEKSGNLSKSPEVAHPSGSSPEPPRTPLSWATSNLEDPRLASPGARGPETPSHQSEKGKLFSRSSWKNRCIHTIIYTFRTLF